MKLHACLLGEWVCLNDDPDCVIGHNGQSPDTWYEENAELWAPHQRKEHSYYELDYVNLVYKGISYRINPIFLQVSEF
ncbi:hypothetical protein AAA081_00445 [Aedoeadaptatus acetigenes]|uniref:Uncharacterized protein n=1 Tax=Aedoeadaptatus acetigenes TaxID=2981723 RepID=A0ABV1J3K8_9FIRM